MMKLQKSNISLPFDSNWNFYLIWSCVPLDFIFLRNIKYLESIKVIYVLKMCFWLELLNKTLVFVIQRKFCLDSLDFLYYADAITVLKMFLFYKLYIKWAKSKFYLILNWSVGLMHIFKLIWHWTNILF